MGRIQKIMFTAPALTGGGAERVVSLLASGLASLGCQVDLVLYARAEDEYPLSPAVHVHSLPARRPGQGTPAYYQARFAALRQLIRTLRPDVLLPFLPYQVEHTFLASRGLGIPLVITVRNHPRFDTPTNAMRRRRDRIAARSAAVFLQSREQLAYFPPRVQQKCFVVPNPVSPEMLTVNHRLSDGLPWRLMTAGRLEAQKNQRLLIEAAATLLDRGLSLELDIYGAGSLQGDLQARIDALGLGERIRLCGRTADMASALSFHDMFVLSSDYEGMPNALLEAMAAGLPCISTDCPSGPADLLGRDGTRGLLTPPGDSAALANCIAGALACPARLEQMGEAARAFACAGFSTEKICRQLLAELERVTESG